MSAVIDYSAIGEAAIGPMEQCYRESAAFRAAGDQTRVTPTHWDIAMANGLGWRVNFRPDLAEADVFDCQATPALRRGPDPAG
jgi:hypothetical protein